MNSTKTSESEEPDYDLRKTFYDLIVNIYTHAYYHERRAHFLRRWSVLLQITDWFLVSGTVFAGLFLAFIEQYRSFSEPPPKFISNLLEEPLFYTLASLAIAAMALLALFISILFDLSKKAEKHRWLTYFYDNLKKEISLIRFFKEINKQNKDQREKCIGQYHKMQHEIAKLIKEERPMLKFLELVSYYTALQELSNQASYTRKIDDGFVDDGSIEDYINQVNKKAVTDAIRAIGKIGCVRDSFINTFSFPLATIKFKRKIQDANYKVWWIKLLIGMMNFLMKLLSRKANTRNDTA